jgi:hypothetical protein
VSKRDKKRDTRTCAIQSSAACFYRLNFDTSAGDGGGKNWREMVAATIGGKGAGKEWRQGRAGNCVNAKRREKLVLGLNNPDLLESGSPGPIS